MGTLVVAIIILPDQPLSTRSIPQFHLGGGTGSGPGKKSFRMSLLVSVAAFQEVSSERFGRHGDGGHIHGSHGGFPTRVCAIPRERRPPSDGRPAALEFRHGLFWTAVLPTLTCGKTCTGRQTWFDGASDAVRYWEGVFWRRAPFDRVGMCRNSHNSPAGVSSW